MSAVTVSPKFQVVIPKEVRESLRIVPGLKLEVFDLNGGIQMIPIVPISSLRGFAKGIDTTIERDEDRL